MRCSGWSSLAISLCSAVALVLAAPASAHIVAVPPFIAASDATTLNLTGPNERDEPMTGFAVTVPSGFEIVHAHRAAGWEASTEGATATWTGGSLASGSEATFGLELEASTEPGTVQLEAAQLYAGSTAVRWPVALIVTPAVEEPSQHLALAAVVGILGLLVVVAVVALAWRRRSGSLQER